MANPKKKVLHIIKSLGRGGAEMLLPETLKLHNKEKFEFHYIYFLPWKNQMVSAIQEAGGKVNCFNATNNIKIILKFGQIIRYCRKHEINLIHCHLPWAGFVGRLVHFLSKIPLVYTEHNKQERYNKITFLINKFSFNFQNLAIAVSDDTKESIEKNIHPKIEVKTILNGVNTNDFQKNEASGIELRKKLGITDDEILIGTIAVFRFQKRIEEWLEVIKMAHDKNPKVRGIVIGDGLLKPEIHKKWVDLGLQNIVIMAGLQTEVKPYLSAMDIYMMTSSFEGLPIALLEAMSMTCPIVTTDAGGIKEMIVDGENGLMVSVENWKQLAEKIEILNQNQNLKLAISEAARKTVLEKFSMNRMVKDLELVYQKLK